MSNSNQIIASLNQIVSVDANNAITGLSLPVGSNADFGQAPSVSLGPIANVHITGGSANQALLTDGSGNLSWGNATGTPGGSNTQVQFNNNGVLGGVPGFTYDSSLGRLTTQALAGLSTQDFYLFMQKPATGVATKTLYIQGGDGSTGTGSVAGGTGGSASIEAGQGGSDGGAGGGVGGVLTVKGGMSSSSGTTKGGNIIVKGGGNWDVGFLDASGGGGDTIVTGGTAKGTGFTSGNVIVSGGTNNNGSTKGSVQISDISVATATATYTPTADTHLTTKAYVDGLSTPPGGSNTQLQFNANGVFGGIANVTYDGATLSLGSVSDIAITGGTANQTLLTDGTGNLRWGNVTVSPAGSNTQIQFNNNGVFGGVSGFTYDSSLGRLTTQAISGLVNQDFYLFMPRPASGVATKTLYLQGGDGSPGTGVVAGGTGGSASIEAGQGGSDGGAGAGNGGVLTVKGGMSSSSGTTKGGNIVVKGGGNWDDGFSLQYNGSGGDTIVTGGTARGAGFTSGNVIVSGGTNNNGSTKGSVQISDISIANTISTYTPTANTHLATKAYVDSHSLPPAGNTYDVQFNAGGQLGAASSNTFQYDDATKSLYVGQLVGGAFRKSTGYSELYLYGSINPEDGAPGGPIYMTSGYGGAAFNSVPGGDGGELVIYAGSGGTRFLTPGSPGAQPGGNGGALTLHGGDVDDGSTLGGDVLIRAGGSGYTFPYNSYNGKGGSTTIYGGKGRGAGNYAGSVTIDAGVAENGATLADVNIGGVSANQISIGSVSSTTYLNGTKVLGSNSTVHITGGSANQALLTDGSGNLYWGSVADAAGIPGGSNTQLQFNANGSFGGIANVTYDGVTLSLGSVSDIAITGGSNGKFLTTDGTGNLSWTGITSTPYAQSIVGADASSYSWTSSVFDSFTANTDINLFYNGVLVNPDAFTLSGNTVTYLFPVRTNDVLAVPASSLVNGTGGGGSTPAGTNGTVQYNNNGDLGANSNFTYSNGRLTVPNATFSTGYGSVFIGTTGPQTTVTTLEIGTAGYGGVLMSHNGTERWYAGKSSEYNGDGAYVINTSGANAFKIFSTSNVGSILANTYITSVNSNRSYEFRRGKLGYTAGAVAIGAGLSTASSALIANSIPGLTFVATGAGADPSQEGYWRNDGPARKFNMDVTTTLAGISSSNFQQLPVAEAYLWIQKNSGTASSSTARYAQKQLMLPTGQSVANAILSTSSTLVLATGDTISAWAYAVASTGGQYWGTGYPAFGIDNGYATRIVITEVL